MGPGLESFILLGLGIHRCAWSGVAFTSSSSWFLTCIRRGALVDKPLLQSWMPESMLGTDP